MFQTYSISSDQEDEFDGLNCNTILYTGLGLATVGLIITFLGLGGKGYRTLEVKMLGPGLVGVGMMLVVLRILFCGRPCFRTDGESEALLKRDTAVSGDFLAFARTGFTREFVSDTKDSVDGAGKMHPGEINHNYSKMYVDSV